MKIIIVPETEQDKTLLEYGFFSIESLESTVIGKSITKTVNLSLNVLDLKIYDNENKLLYATFSNVQ